MTPAPTGTAAGISGWLRTYIYQARRTGGLTIDQKTRLDRLDACSSEAVAVGDDDPRVRTLALYSAPHWEPGPAQRAVVDGAGHAAARGPYGKQNSELSGEKLNGNALLNALAFAATEDLQTLSARELSRLKRSAEVAPTQAALLEVVTARANGAEKALVEAQQSVEHLNGRVLEEKTRRRAAEAAVNGDAPEVESNGAPTPESEEKLPTGVRQRGGSFEAYWRADGQQRQRGGFDTVEEAVAVRNRALEEAKVHELAKAAQAGGHDTFNPSPEDLAAMQEAGTR